ncbi:MAG TPA: hypothetical protein VK034_16530 [Enhygromyxa sp.]|nr:hypothetical protein [Enhygromyxa sp.]
MAKHDDQSKPDSTALARLDDHTPWRGDEHELRLSAAREAGLSTEQLDDVELELFTAGFKAGMILDDRADRSIVLRGRTVLREKQMIKALNPTLRFLSIPRDQIALRIHDGEFELRIGRAAVDAAQPALDHAKLTLRLWFGAGATGFVLWSMFKLAWAASILWGLALVVGGYLLRQGTFSGRSMLAARLTVALAMLAKEEQLILPPARVGERERS